MPPLWVGKNRAVWCQPSGSSLCVHIQELALGCSSLVNWASSCNGPRGGQKKVFTDGKTESARTYRVGRGLNSDSFMFRISIAVDLTRWSACCCLLSWRSPLVVSLKSSCRPYEARGLCILCKTSSTVTVMVSFRPMGIGAAISRTVSKVSALFSFPYAFSEGDFWSTCHPGQPVCSPSDKGHKAGTD